MKRILFIFILLLLLVGCSYNNEDTENTQTTSDITNNEEETEEVKMILKIGSVIIDVTWYDNASVKDLMNHVNNELTIELHEYGNFEQTGLLGFTLVSNDERMNVGPGDIVLYNSNQICLYYGNNSWSFTKLGRINLTEDKIKELLSTSDKVTITLEIKK